MDEERDAEYNSVFVSGLIFFHLIPTAVLPNFHDIISWQWHLSNWSKGFPHSGGL